MCPYPFVNKCRIDGLKTFAKFILRLIGWKISVKVPYYKKSVICVAPHTSNWDFIIGKIGYAATGRKTHCSGHKHILHDSSLFLFAKVHKIHNFAENFVNLWRLSLL